MPEHEHEFLHWRAAASAHLVREELEELEDHLRQSLARELERGLEFPEAWRTACERLGAPAELARQFHPTRHLMRHASRLFGLLLTASIVVFALDGTHALSSFFDSTQALLVLGLLGAGLWTSFGPATVVRALAHALEGRAACSEEEAREHDALFARARALAWSSGALAGAIGVLLALSALGSPADLAVALARSALGPFYGALLAELFFANLRPWVAVNRPALARGTPRS